MAQPLFIGNLHLQLDTVDSTNRYAKDYISKNSPPEGTAISAVHQAAGRGQLQKSWHSSPGQNLTFSLILYPKFLPAHAQFLLNQAISLGLHDALSPLLGESLKIKWPNDLFFGTQKLAGTLIETQIQQKNLAQAVVGIGLNINEKHFPDDLSSATSLYKITGQHQNLETYFQTICWSIERRYLQLRSGQYDRLRMDYTQALLGYQETQTFFDKHTEETFDAYILGVNTQGELALQCHTASTETPKIQYFPLHQLRWIF